MTRHGCPVRAVTEESQFWLSLFGFYKAGVLWRGGGLGEQPYVYLRAMATVESEVEKVHRQMEADRRVATSTRKRT